MCTASSLRPNPGGAADARQPIPLFNRFRKVFLMSLSRRSVLLATAAGASSLWLTACGGSDDDGPGNIVQVASADSRFSILVEAVVAANLGATLSGPGPFTVFAPTNDAFAGLLTELHLSKDALLANTALLTQVLTYHVLPAKVMAADVVALPKPASVVTVQGANFTVGADLGITDARGRLSRLLVTDVAASNGVIHAIDKVLLPPA